ncbi:hypothetical protein HK15_12960 [Acetobacter orientalis]|uniref:Uncharacterized protein n=1 Tax=Acetobacter orientalis TaxID=146474 RepID=A0A252B3J0_9PROT|nr:hypothetical protein HK15_12960 [Acetobacter orientalis]
MAHKPDSFEKNDSLKKVFPHFLTLWEDKPISCLGTPEVGVLTQRGVYYARKSRWCRFQYKGATAAYEMWSDP